MFSILLLSVILPVILAQSQPSYLSGKHFRVGTYEIPFWAYPEVNAQNETIVSGMFIVMLDWMSSRHNFTYTIVFVSDDTEFEALPAIFKDKKIDWLLGNYIRQYRTTYLAQYTYPVFFSTHSVVIPYPKPEVNVYSVILPYTTLVWVCFFASMAVISFLLICFARAKKFIHQHEEPDAFSSYEGSILYVVGVATNQGAACFSKAPTVRLLAGVWCLAAFVMVNAYSSSLITYLMAPKLKPLIKSIRDIDNKSEPQILAPATEWFRELTEISPTYQWLRDNAFKVPNEFCGIDFADEERNEQCLSLVKKGKHVYVTDTSAAELYVHWDYKKTGTCALTIAEEEILAGYGGWVLPLDSPHEIRNAVDVLLLETISYGLMSHWVEIANETPLYCLHYKTVEQSLRKLFLKDLASAFVILGAGTGLSLIVFAYEVAKGRLLPEASRRKPRTETRVKLNQRPLEITDASRPTDANRRLRVAE